MLPKWFVRSGQLREIVEAETQIEAMEKALLKSAGPYGFLIGATEIKPGEIEDNWERHLRNEEYAGVTEFILKKLGIEFKKVKRGH